MSYTIRYNRATNHIDGISARSTGKGEANGGVVGYFASNACGSLTRGSLATGRASEDLAEILAAARLGNRKLCKNCEKAALAALSSTEAPVAEDAPAEAPTDHTVNISGAVTGFIDGIGAISDPSTPDERMLSALWNSGTERQFGRGVRKTITVPGWALVWLAEYVAPVADGMLESTPAERKGAKAFMLNTLSARKNAVDGPTRSELIAGGFLPAEDAPAVAKPEVEADDVLVGEAWTAEQYAEYMIQMGGAYVAAGNREVLLTPYQVQCLGAMPTAAVAKANRELITRQRDIADHLGLAHDALPDLRHACRVLRAAA